MNSHNIEALLFIGPDCPHCAVMIHVLTELIKKGTISKLELVNVEQAHDMARRMGVRSVPWLKLGYLQLQGAHREAEIINWVDKLKRGVALSDYLVDGLKTGQLQKIIDLVKQDRQYLLGLLDLLSQDDLDLKIKLGISAVIEDIQGSELLKSCVQELAFLLQHKNVNTKIDALHFLSLTHSNAALPFVRSGLNDSHPSVREAAQDALELLSDEGR